MKLFRKLTAFLLSAALISSQIVNVSYADDTYSEEYESVVYEPVDYVDDDGSLSEEAELLLDNYELAEDIEEKIREAELSVDSDVEDIEVALTDNELAYIRAVDAKDRLNYYGSVRSVRMTSAARSKYANNYFYDQMTNAEKELYNNIYDTCNELMSDNIDLSKAAIGSGISFSALGLTYNEAKQVNRLFYYSNPQFFFLKNGVTYGPTSNPTYIMPMCNDEFLKGSVRQTYKSKINSLTSSWMSSINAASTPLKKQQVIYTKLCEHITYVKTTKDQSIAGALVDKECVCNGYALSSQYFCSAAGLNCITARSKTHAWNIIEFDNTWYEFDVTWMDKDGYIAEKWLNKSHATFLSNDTNSSHEYDLSYYGKFTLPSCPKDLDNGDAETVASVKIKTLPTKLEYYVGEDLKLTGGVLAVTYENGTGVNINMASSRVTATGFDSSKPGKVTVTVTFGGKSAKFTVTILSLFVEENVLLTSDTSTIDPDGIYFENLSSAFSYIDSLSDSKATYTAELMQDVTETDLTFPSAAKCVIISGETLTVEGTSPKLAPKSSLTLDTVVLNPGNKAFTVTVPSSSVFTLGENADITIGTITGKSTATLEIESDTKIESVSTFKKIDIADGAVLTVSNKLTSVTALDGTLVMTGFKSTNTAKITNAGTADLILTRGTVSGKAAVAPVTITKITGEVTLTVIDANGNAVDLEPGLQVLTAGTTTDITDKITITNTDSKGNELKVVQNGKAITVSNAGGVVEPNVLVTGSKGFSGYASDLSGAFTLIDEQKNKNESYTVELLEDITEDSLTFPTYASEIILTGSKTLTLTAATPKLLPKSSLVIDTEVVSSKKKAIAVTMALKMTFSVTENGAVSLGAVTGKSSSVFEVPATITAASVTTFGNVIVSDGAVLTVTDKMSGITNLSGSVKLTGYKSTNSARITNINKADFTLTIGKVSSKNAVAAVTVNKITDELTITVVDAQNKEAVLEKGMIIAKAGSNNNIADKIVITNTDSKGDGFRASQSGKDIVLESANAVTEPNVLITGTNNYTSYASDVSTAFELITAKNDKKAVYTLELLEDVTENTLTFPTAASGIVITGKKKLTLTAALPKLLPKTSFIIDCEIVSSKKKAISVTMPANTSLTIGENASVTFGTLTGKSSSSLIAGTDTTVTNVTTFKSVTTAYGAVLTVTGKMSGITNLSGTVAMTGFRTSNSAKITNIGTASFILTTGKVSGNNSIAAVTVTNITDSLSITINDAKGKEAQLESGTVIAYSAKTADIQPLDEFVTITNTDPATGKPFTVIHTDKTIIAV